jgi:hypothetical protein
LCPRKIQHVSSLLSKSEILVIFVEMGYAIPRKTGFEPQPAELPYLDHPVVSVTNSCQRMCILILMSSHFLRQLTACLLTIACFFTMEQVAITTEILVIQGCTNYAADIMTSSKQSVLNHYLNICMKVNTGHLSQCFVKTAFQFYCRIR